MNPPAQKRRSYWTRPDQPPDPEAWLAGAEQHPGSWWPHWGAWLGPHGGRRKAAPRMAGNAKYPALEDAPGSYVREKAG